MTTAHATSGNPLALLRRLPGPVQALVAGAFINRLGSFIFPFLSLVLTREFTLPAEQVAGVMAAYGVGSILSILLGGVLTDALGRRRTMLLGMFGSGLLAIGMGFTSGTRVLIPLLFAFSLLTDLYRPPSSALISDLLPSADRPVGYAAQRMAVNLGFFFGIGAGGVLVDHSYRLMFALDGLTTLACGALIFAAVPETRRATIEGAAAVAPDGAPAPRAAASRGPTSPLRDPPFLLLCTASFLVSLSFNADFIIFPLTVTRGAGYPAAVFGLLLGLNGLGVALVEVTATAWLRRYRRLRVAGLGAAVAGLGFGLIGLWMHWAWFLMAAVFCTAGEILVAPQQVAFAADWAPPAARGRYLSLHGATWSLAAVVGPAVLLPLHERLGDARFWLIVAVMHLPAVGVFLDLDRRADLPERLRGRG